MRRNAGGFGLIEMLLATAIFAVVGAVALLFHAAASRSFAMAITLTDQQQSTRVAFNRVTSDLLMAGFNADPDGDPTRTDEAIEGAWDTALTFRADFDSLDPAESSSPEEALAGTAYGAVTTGNDEIVTYALAKSGPAGPDLLGLRLEADRPRSGIPRIIAIPKVALVQDDPPYTLYRITLADRPGAFPSSPNASSDFIYEPVADNIRSLTFRYWSDGGEMLGPDTPGDPADDLGGGDSGRAARGRIRRISIRLVGMTDAPDPEFIDAGDATTARHNRKLALEGEIRPENLGWPALREKGPPAPDPAGGIRWTP